MKSRLAAMEVTVATSVEILDRKLSLHCAVSDSTSHRTHTGHQFPNCRVLKAHQMNSVKHMVNRIFHSFFRVDQEAGLWLKTLYVRSTIG